MQKDPLSSTRTRPVAIWLMVGAGMIMVQVILGGITRLTGSGLSITQWDPIVGAIPPLNHLDWMRTFQLYRQTPQFHLQHPDYTLGDFKAIFFWEYLHRLWARLLGVVFLIPFVVFLVQRRFSRNLVRPMVILFLLGALQGLIGWIMVESGLSGDNVRVSHIRLAAHFIVALFLLAYTFWFGLSLIVGRQQGAKVPLPFRLSVLLLGMLGIQLIYGAFMAGLHAELYAPTWPDINGSAVPSGLFRTASEWVNNPLTVQFIHRGMAYLILVGVIWLTFALKNSGSRLLERTRFLPLAMVLLQVCLGILTILGSRIRIPIPLAICHQFGAMLLLLSLIWICFLVRRLSPAPIILAP